jgi:UDP-N-acetylmuramoyl-L-alanyl-D-glutamate--2,6-diaminopimelate ligase
MKLSEIIRNIPVKVVAGSADVEVSGINIDSRLVASGHLFVALKGTQTDGHRFIAKAVE